MRIHLVRWVAPLLMLAMLAAAACACARPPGVEPGRVSHVVLFWLNTPGDPQALQKLSEACLSFRETPGVREVVVGKALPSDRPVVDSSFDLGVVITFSGPEALRNYQQDPKHQRAVADLLKPLVKRIQVYDIVSPPHP